SMTRRSGRRRSRQKSKDSPATMWRALALALSTSVAHADVRLATPSKDIGTQPKSATAVAADYERENGVHMIHGRRSFVGVVGRVRAIEIDQDGAWDGAKGWGICSVLLVEHFGEGFAPPKESRPKRLLVWRNGEVDAVFEEHLQPRTVKAGCKLLCSGSDTAD